MRRLSSLIILKTLKEAGNFMEITWWGIREEPHKTTCHFGDSSLRTWSKHFTLKKQKVFQFFFRYLNLIFSEQPLSLWVCRHEQTFPPSCMTCEDCQHSPLCNLRDMVIPGNWRSLTCRIRIDNVVHCSFFCMLQLLSRSNRCFCGCAVMNSRFPRHL